ncbi:hypothetical protein LH433_02610 [Laribacter hongkongensis]|uniref:hypothetical protein n=1 Tax=Laribacter hongkongensis TaxID=168471 RepID=UPI001EFDEAD7|nr:hypothetical protein [Laribacter hongkongensis]MCG9105649.1 hypothetical protein [Laribacter hongkongensis]
MSTSTPSICRYNLDERYADKLADFANQLEQSRFWHVLPTGETDPAKASGLFDTQTGMLYSPLQRLSDFLRQHPFVFIKAAADRQRLATLHTATRLLWNNALSKENYGLEGARKQVQQGRWARLQGWQLPSKDQLYSFATAKNNPHRHGQEYRLLNVSNSLSHTWMTDAGCCYTDNGCWDIAPGSYAYVFAVNSQWRQASDAELMAQLCDMGVVLVVEAQEKFEPAQTKPSNEDLLASLVTGGQLQAVGIDTLRLDPTAFDLTTELAELDYQPCRLPRSDAARLGDPHKGLWELWGEPATTLENFGLVARDPKRDVQQRAVSIDFGTSSTVVAMETEHGGRELLRIGVRDFYQPVEARHFENPTVLECMNYAAFSEEWKQQAYRPALDWSWMRAAHEAQASFRDNPGDIQVLASILPRLKQWALRSTNNDRLRITDRAGYEFELSPHMERNPVRGQPLPVNAGDSFDPIELYAWYLGMAINWRERGLFLKYYLSFPVKYPREVRERILASFRRGLQRSLPQSLIDHYPEFLHEFEVNDLASEPAAYAASALAKLGVAPSDEGVPYAVFDFGGGTTDFDFGLLRWSNPQEEVRGYDQIFEHLASNGDNFLGGENLLEHLVYASFQHNLDVLRGHRIQFTRPLDAATFPGCESFIAMTQAAQTNSVMLAAKLRPFLEGERAELTSQLKLDLIDANGNKQSCELLMDAQMLDELLAVRIRRGVQAFLAELARLSPVLPAKQAIHVLLAGNGSRSRHIAALFEGESWKALCGEAFGEAPPDIVVHPPLVVDETDPHSPTAKTGVALGLLRLIPGENTLLLDHVHHRHDGQAPFSWYTGRMRRGCFEPVLLPGTGYGQWQEVGPLQTGVFNLFVSTSPRAHALTEGDPELRKHRLYFPVAAPDAKLFVRAVAPNRLELGTALDVASISCDEIEALELV